MKPNKLSKFVAPTAAVLAVLAGAGEAADRTTGINLFPDTATSLGNYASEVNGACEAFPGTPERPEGVTTIKMGFVVNDVLRGNTATTKDIRVVAGANGAQVDYKGDDTGPVYIAPGQTIISHTQALTTPAATGLDVWSRNVVRTSVTKEVVSVYALNPRVALPKGGFTQEDTFTAKYAEIKKLVCVPERHVPVTQDTTPPPAEVKAPTNPETPAQGTPTPEVCPAVAPNISAMINMPRFIRVGGRAVVRWSVENTDTIPLLSPTTTVTLPKGSFIAGPLPRGYRVSGGRQLVKNPILSETNLLEADEDEEDKVKIGFTKVSKKFRATATVKASAKNPKIGPDGRPCLPANARKKADAIVLPTSVTKTPAVAGSLSKTR